MLSCQRHLFSLPDNAHYINCAYMSPLLKSAEEAGISGMRLKRIPSMVKPAMFFDECDQVRRLFARLTGVSDQQVALISAASYGVAAIAHNVTVAKGQNIVVLHEQFPSNVYSWQRLAHTSGATLRTVAPPNGPRRLEILNARIIDAIDADTALVSVGPVHWADGTQIDLASIGQRARDVGAFFVVDGTQSVGALPIDAQALGIDALICAAYKWLLGPYGIGVMYVGERFLDGIPLEESWLARRGSENFGALVNYSDEYQRGAIRYDVGGHSNFILVPMMVRALEQILSWGPENIQDYCRTLMGTVQEEILSMGYRITEGSSAHLFGLHVPDHISRHRLQDSLEREGVSVSLRGKAIRISPHVYNNSRDIAALCQALADASRSSAPSYSIPS